MKVKKGRIMLLRELFVTQMNHWTFFPIYLAFVVILGDISMTGTPNPLYWLFSGAIPFLFYIVRIKLKFVWMILLHMVVIGIYVILPSENIVIKLLQVAVALIYVVYSIALWAKERERKDGKVLPLLMVGISVVTMYLLHHQNHREWDSAIIISLIAVIGLYFMNYYIEQYQNFLTVNQSSAGHIPAREMFRSGIGLVTGYTGIAIILLIFVSNVDWLLAILNVGRVVLSFLIRGLQALFVSDGLPKEELAINESSDMAGDMMAGLETGEGFWLWQVLEYIIIFVFLALFVIVLFKCFISLVRWLRKKLKQPYVIKQDISPDDVVDVREKCEIIRDNQWRKDFRFWNLSPSDRIRHLYKKKILASQSSLAQANQHEKLNLFTARESGRILEREELAYLYEKARYSQEECNSEDVKQMKAACK